MSESQKKSQINHWTSNSAYGSAPGPSLGFLGPNSMVSSNLVSVRSGRTGLVSYEPGSVWGCNSRLRVARTNLTSNSDSTSNFGSYRFFSGQI